MAKAQRRKGADVEREMARMMGGKRMVMSGGSVLGGGDLVFPSDSPFSSFLWEVKARAKVPEIMRIALEQARQAAIGSMKYPAYIIKADGQKPIVGFYLEDFIQWAEALGEMGSGDKMKALIRQVENTLTEMKRTI